MSDWFHCRPDNSAQPACADSRRARGRGGTKGVARHDWGTDQVATVARMCIGFGEHGGQTKEEVGLLRRSK